MTSTRPRAQCAVRALAPEQAVGCARRSRRRTALHGNVADSRHATDARQRAAVAAHARCVTGAESAAAQTGRCPAQAAAGALSRPCWIPCAGADCSTALAGASVPNRLVAFVISGGLLMPQPLPARPSAQPPSSSAAGRLAIQAPRKSSRHAQWTPSTVTSRRPSAMPPTRPISAASCPAPTGAPPP
jgi:hypothetical protein